MFNLFKKQAGDMWLIVGLGNPGGKYERNRHNIGFMAADAIAGAHNFPAFRAKFQGEISEMRTGAGKLILLKPMTMLNGSGTSVAQASRFYKIPPEKIIVFHDELDLLLGKIRVKRGGGHAGHNGLRSIDDWLGSSDYIRVRMGIGHPGSKDKVHGHVLGDFAGADQEWLAPLLEVAGKYAPLLTEGHETEFMNKVANAGGGKS